MSTIQKTFGLKSPPVFKLKPTISTAFPDLIMGTELEIEGCAEGVEWAEQVANIGFRVENDGSLRGRNNTNGNQDLEGYGLEFISKPMESDVLATAVHQFFQKTKFTEKNYSDRCSVHVHVNCQNLEWADVACISLLYSVVEDCLFHFIGNNRSNNIFCIPWSQCRISYDLVDKLTKENSGVPHAWQKYTALNLQPLERYGTVEFRHMEGTHDPERITQWLNIIGSMFRYCRGTNIGDLMKEVLALNTSSDYRGFFDRVFMGNLHYNDEFETYLENGVINAKLQSINYGKEKPRRQPEIDDAAVIPQGRPLSPARRAAAGFAEYANTIQVNLPAAGGGGGGLWDGTQAPAAPDAPNRGPVEWAARVTPLGEIIHPRNPGYTDTGTYHFTPDSRGIHRRLTDYINRYGEISTGDFVRLYSAIQEVERNLWYIKEQGVVARDRGFGETNDDYRNRISELAVSLSRERDARVQAHQRTSPRADGENGFTWMTRTAEEADYLHFQSYYGVTAIQCDAIRRMAHESVAAHCRRVAAHFGIAQPARIPR